MNDEWPDDKYIRERAIEICGEDDIDIRRQMIVETDETVRDAVKEAVKQMWRGKCTIQV